MWECLLNIYVIYMPYSFYDIQVVWEGMAMCGVVGGRDWYPQGPFPTFLYKELIKKRIHPIQVEYPGRMYKPYICDIYVIEKFKICLRGR
jgi:hypothetical protein